jgi:tRNA(Glu) U13 pseudouridine synthase TruD
MHEYSNCIDDDTIECTELERIQGKKRVDAGDCLALVATFSLQSASYATMLIRELTKKLDVQSGLV